MGNAHRCSRTDARSNRTFMELKWSMRPALCRSESVLIVPLWN